MPLNTEKTAKNITSGVKALQNIMFFVLFAFVMSNFAQEGRKAEFVSSLFLTNSALFQVLSCLFSSLNTTPFSN